MIPFGFLTALLIGMSGALAVPAGAAAGQTIVPLAVTGQEATIRGMVEAKSTGTLVVNNATINTPASTPCERDGHPYMLSDIKVGDWLKVTAFHDLARDQYVATMIEVLAPQD